MVTHNFKNYGDTQLNSKNYGDLIIRIGVNSLLNNLCCNKNRGQLPIK